MPTVFRKGKYRFFFFSNEGQERPHIHVESGNDYAKYWIEPVVLAHSTGYSRAEVNEIGKIVEKAQDIIKEKWNAHFGY
ncbi:MAG: DUF4160 domain-containing protein [Candidatus Aminicenantes bacterium]|nr:DUF4160 domain-containing protein [Candidatus Aminicenantes bacterium]